MLTFCIAAVEEAIGKHGAPEIFNTDQGCQFISHDFTEVLKKANVRISKDGKGPWINTVTVERKWK